QIGPDGWLPGNVLAETAGLSVHGMLCSWLADNGTREAVPGLLNAIERGRALPPTPEVPYRFDRLAALAIARRDPWTDVDAWLRSVMTRNEPLIDRTGDGPQLGATAAAILLRRHGASPDSFGLVPCGDAIVRQCCAVGYRYAAVAGADQIAGWWSQRGGPDHPEDGSPVSPAERTP
ncbi:MAG: hypothetical protein ACYC6Y_27125, partial [Thermoguttaceae bacterium]